MGVESRKAPPLPAPTETDSTTGGTELESKVSNFTSGTLPEDGSPITIATRRKKHEDSGGLSSNKSQTSLLIEYFEGGKGSQAEPRRPSVRVKVTPSSKSRSRSGNDHIQITERKGTRKPSYTKRIPLSSNTRNERSPGDEADDHSLRSDRSATEESNVTSRGGNPIEVEIMPRRHGSPLIPAGENNSRIVQQNASDISSMPADSFLDGKTRSPEKKRSRSLTRGEALAAGAGAGLIAAEVMDKLKTPSRRRSRSLSRERIVAQKAVEKVKADKSSERRRKHSSRSRSVSEEQHTEGVKSPRRRSSRGHHEESLVSGANSSLLNSQLSGKSGDQYSFRSGTSKSSINNPKLLETVEDAIRRLILPELTALKREQSKHAHRDRDRRGSVTSGSNVSRESREDSSTRRLSDRGSASEISGKPKVILNDKEVLSGSSSKRRKDKHGDRGLNQGSPRSFEREASEETVTQDGDRLHKKRSSDRGHGLEAAAVGAGVGALTAAALHKHHSRDSLDEKKERRRRRTRSHSRGDSMAESYEEREDEMAPPMPLMSEINPSEVTRSSILSAETDRPGYGEHEATPVREVPRGVVSPASRTPTRTPVALQQGLHTQHSNYSQGNLSLHSPHSEDFEHGEEYEVDQHGRKIALEKPPRLEHEDWREEVQDGSHSHALEAGLVGAAAGAGLATLHHSKEHHDDLDDHDDPELLEDDYFYYQNNQEVPPPLRYVPYSHERRGLSPIPSVSGYTEGDPEQAKRESKLTRSTGSYSSMDKSAQQDSRRSLQSSDSASNLRHNKHDFADIRHGGLTESELTQDGEYWEEQHRENDRNRDLDAESYRSSDPRVDYKHLTNYTDDSMDAPGLGRVAAGQNVRGVGANPDYVHTPHAVESAVASLVNASELTTGSGYTGGNAPHDRRESYASYEDGSERQFTSSRNSPTKQGISRDFGNSESDRGTSSRHSPTKHTEEYDIDEHGRKVAMPKYTNKHPGEAATLVGIAAGAAAAVLSKNRNKTSQVDQVQHQNPVGPGAPMNKSFKDRALEGQGQRHSLRDSIDIAPSDVASQEDLKMGASGLPDLNNPEPAIGYGDGDSDVTTNPSVIHGPIGGAQETSRDHWPSHPTPPQAALDHEQAPSHHSKAADAALVLAAAGAAAAVGSHSREVSHDHDDEWQRTSGDRKRDTILTNPFEGTSPIAAIGGGLDSNLLAQSGYQGLNTDFNPSKLGFQAASPGGLPKDEGYISAPNARSPGAITPEARRKGVGFLDQELDEDMDGMGAGDPFYTPKHSRHLSGMSHGMGSPLYDSATGNGIDRIQSKDIVALMDHLTVRDAQRSARDTEILVTLVRAAAEMRNSFEDMKRLLADTEDVIITEVQQNTDKSVQKAINGPRPLPPSATRSVRQGSQDDTIEDIPAKRRNVFRRALKGLSMRSSNDLGKIEEMLVQLLGDVEGLKVAQGIKTQSHPSQSYEDLDQEGNYEHDHGYEPEGNAGTSTASHASQSGHLSLPLSRGASTTKGFDGRKFSDHRISTVPEGDEEEIDHNELPRLNTHYEPNPQLLSPSRDVARGSSAPLGTPPLQHVAPASLSNENTPRTDKSKKHKSSSSSGWIPKVSRWSETTASTVLRGFRSSGRGSGRKGEEQYAEPHSRSGSDLGHFAENDPYGEDKLHSGFSQEQLQDYQDLEPPAALLSTEDPKYKAHRNSINLQHPQPRPGPTHRYQTALESQAQSFSSPMSPKSVDWGSNTSLNRLPPQQTNRYSNGSHNAGNLSPISDGGYSNGSASNQAPERPPKEPLAPERPPKIRTGKLQKPSPLSNEHLNENEPYASGSGAAEHEASPQSARRSLSGALAVPPRKPLTGPRSMSSASRSGELNREDGTVRRNKNRDTFGTIASNHSAESETF